MVKISQLPPETSPTSDDSVPFYEAGGASTKRALISDIIRAGTGAWTPYSPTITSGSGTLTSVSASGAYNQIGKTVTMRVSVTITNNGTGATTINIPLPVAALHATDNVGYGRERVNTGKSLIGNTTGGTLLQMQFYDNTYPGANGNVLVVNSIYEVP